MKKAILCSIGFTLLLLQINAQDLKLITGKVINSNQEELIGVNIVTSDDISNGTISDIDGTFEINVSDTSSLEFSFIGYTSRTIKVASQLDWTIVLEEAIETFDEIVVVGYGVQRKSDLTGSIDRVEAEELTRIPTPNLEQALQGKSAGVQVITSSGRPGSGAEIRIRGVGTLNNASPLYVVDGMLLDDISFLNIQDVASVEILKDASATAIYGSRGANGVIIISTNKGSVQDKPTITLSSYYGWQELASPIDLTDANQYAVLANELSENEGRMPIFDDPSIFSEGVDWQEELYRTAPMQNYQLTVAGGNDKMLYNISANYFDQEGIQQGSEYSRATLRINNEYKISDKIRIGHNLSFALVNQELAPDISSTAYRADPTIPPTDENGEFNDLSINTSTGNPSATIFYSNSTNRQIRTVGNVYANVPILKDFTLRSSFGIDRNDIRSRNFVPEFFVSATQRNDMSSLTVRSDEQYSWLWENTLNYNKTFGAHVITGLLGMTSQEFRNEGLGATGFELIGDSDEFLFLQAAQSDEANANNGASEWAMISYLVRVNYVYDNKYLFTGSFRTDGSSRFGASNRYGYFPSFAVGWNISNEPFLKSIPFLSRLKIRASWGRIGNDKIGPYPGREVVSTPIYYALGTDEELSVGSTIEGLPNENVQWEETTQSNIGLEFGFLDNRLQGEIDYYDRTTDKILIDLALPGHFGIRDNFPFVNAAKVNNRGIDLKLDWQDRIGKLTYSVGGLLSTVTNEVLELGEGKDELFGGPLGTGGKFGTRTTVGSPIGAFYGYEVEGVFQTTTEIDNAPKRGGEVPGDLRFRDSNGDGIITTDDRTMIGSPIPDVIYGFNASLTIAGFDFNIEFNGQAGNEIFNAKKMARFGTYNFETTFLDRWNENNPSQLEPRVTNGGHNYEESERFIEDGSYLRMRNVSLGYSLSEKILNKIGFQRLRVYITGNNLLTWTDYTGYTPEIARIPGGNILSVGIDRGVYPIAKTLSCGIDIIF